MGVSFLCGLRRRVAGGGNAGKKIHPDVGRTTDWTGPGGDCFLSLGLARWEAPAGYLPAKLRRARQDDAGMLRST